MVDGTDRYVPSRRHRAARVAALTGAAATVIGACTASHTPPPPEAVGVQAEGLAGPVVTQHNDNQRTGLTASETVLSPTSNWTPTLPDGGVPSGGGFGKLFTRFVDGEVYAQPLYVPGRTVYTNNGQTSCGVHDLVIVATTNNNVYAFDAKNYGTDPLVTPGCNTGLFWSMHLDSTSASGAGDYPEMGRPNVNAGMNNQSLGDACPSAGAYGIMSTPVVDPATGTLFFLSKSVSADGATTTQYLYSLSVSYGTKATLTGREIGRYRNGTGITFDVTGNGYGVPFDARQLNRSALLLTGGDVFVAFGGHCDAPVSANNNPATSYHGWIMRFGGGTSMAFKGAWVSTPEDVRGGIWQSGNGIASDDGGRLYVQTGNNRDTGDTGATLPSPRHASDYSNAFVSLTTTLSGAVAYDQYGGIDTYAPPACGGVAGQYQGRDYLDCQDLDIGSAGSVLLPSSLLVGGGKTGRMFLLDRPNLDTGGTPRQHFQATQNQLSGGAQHPNNCVYGPAAAAANNGGFYPCPHIHGGPVYTHNAMYVWGEADRLRAFQFDPGQNKFVTSALAPLTDANALTSGAVGSTVLNDAGDSRGTYRVMPGGSLSLSAADANGTGALVWATHVLRDNAEYKNVDGSLRVYDAAIPYSPNSQQTTLAEKWHSDPDIYGPDALGFHAKYVSPTIADGNVYVATASGRLVVYGPLSRRQAVSTTRWHDWTPVGDPICISPTDPGAPWAAGWDDGWTSWGLAKANGKRCLPDATWGADLVAIARDATHMDLFGVDENGFPMNAGWYASPGSWNPGYSVPNASHGTAPHGHIAVLSRAPSTLNIYAIDTAGHANQQAAWTTGGSWTAGATIPALAPAIHSTPGGNLTAISRDGTSEDIYLVDDNGGGQTTCNGLTFNTGILWNAGWRANGWHAGYNPNPTSTTWPQRTYPANAPVAAVARNPNVVDLFITDSCDGHVWDADSWTAGIGWRGGRQLPVPTDAAGTVSFMPGTPITAVSLDQNHVDLYAVGQVATSSGTQNKVYLVAAWAAGVNNNNWSAGYPLSDSSVQYNAKTRVTAVMRDATHVDVYAVDTSGTIRDVAYWAGAGWIAGYRISLPSVIDAVGFRASRYNGQALANQYGAQLASFVSANGVATSRSATHTDLFAVGNSGQIYTAWWDANVQ
jgi:hypothetical protein